MIPMPIVYVTDMERSSRFYQALGGTVKSASPYRTELRFGESVLALHRTDQIPEGQPEQLGLGFVATERLESYVARFDRVGISLYRDISDEAFGRSLMIQDPDGLVIQLSEHDPIFYP